MLEAVIVALLLLIYLAGGWASLFGAFIGMALCMFVIEPVLDRRR